MQTLYEQDFYAWTKEQAEILVTTNLEGLDIEHIQEELLSMGISQENALESRLEILLAHLLKYHYCIEPHYQTPPWNITIFNQRMAIKKLLKKMPSLKRFIYPDYRECNFKEIYGDAITSVSYETNLDKTIFPTNCPWTIEQILDNEFYP